MLHDSIKTWKNGQWQRAIVKKWNGSAWEVCEVWSTDAGRAIEDNLNATAKIKTYYPTWRARYNMSAENYWDYAIDKVSTDNATIFECGNNYNNQGLVYSIYIGMPQATIAQDALNTFGISKIVITHTLHTWGAYNYGNGEIRGHQAITAPTIGSPAPDGVDEGGGSEKYYLDYWFAQNGIESLEEFDKIFYDIASGIAKGIVLSPDWYSEQKWFSISNLKFVVTWASK